MRPQIRWLLVLSAFVGVLVVGLSLTDAQPGPGDKKSAETVADFVSRMMAFDKDKDGKLSKDEITDPRLHALFDRADANKDGTVTREELEALYAREGGDAGGKDGFGPGGPKGKKGPKGKGPPPPGEKKEPPPGEPKK